LVVEDEYALARLGAMELDRLVEATLEHTIEEARTRLSGRAFDVILLDLLHEVTARGDETAVIILTGNADLNSAIQPLRLDAYDYLIKPCRIVELQQHLERIARQQRLRDENRALRLQILAQRAPSELVASGPPLTLVRNLIARAAPTNVSVLISAETGTGKEVAARLIHAQSLRRDEAFVPVNCAALPRELAESELFGHRKGAFTGADRDHRALLLAATRGTLLLDEVGDLPMEMQAKFLRLLENAEARRVGDTDFYHTDVRIIAATNRDLRKDVENARFRQDLFYRLAGFDLPLPSLRDIVEDLPAIAVPGAVAERFSPAALLAEGTIAQVEWLMIQQALRRHGGNKTAAAKSLGISLRTLYNKLQFQSFPQEAVADAEQDPATRECAPRTIS
jgi:DNA-binding NtrC family response regulator